MTDDFWDADREMQRIEATYQAGDFDQALAMLEAFELDYDWSTDAEEEWAQLRRAQLQVELGDRLSGLDGLRKHFDDYGFAGFKEEDQKYLDLIEATVDARVSLSRRVGVGVLVVNLVPLVLLMLGYRSAWLLPTWLAVFVISMLVSGSVTPQRIKSTGPSGDIGGPP